MLDYRPDLDPTTPGLLTDIQDMMPTAKGYKVWSYATAQTSHSLTLGGTESAISSLYATRWLTSPGGIVIAGTDKDLYVYDYTNGFIKVSKAGGYSLAGSTYQFGEDSTAAFDHCSFGDVLIATHKSVKPQYRSALDLTISTLYADLGTTVAAPKASVCATANNFVFLGDLGSTWGSAASVVGTPDMVAWCALGDHQNWDVPPNAQQGGWQQFVDTPGPITALCRLNDGIVVFKSNSMYFGRYVGSGSGSPIWDFERVSDRIGCIGHRSVVDVGGKLVFVGPEDAYIFDGTPPRSITEGIWETEFKNKTTYLGIAAMWVGHDKVNNCVMIRRPTAPGYTLLWSYRYNKWSKLKTPNSNVSSVQATDYNGSDVFCKTNTNDLRAVTTTQLSGSVSLNHFDLYTMFATTSALTLGVPTACKCYNRFNTDLYPTAAAYVQTGAIGSDSATTVFTRLTPKWVEPNGGIVAATCEMDKKASLGNAWTVTGLVVNMNADKRFDLLATGVAATNYARFKLSFTNAIPELVDIAVDPKPAGKR